MKFFNRIKQSFKGFTEKVRSASKAVTQGIKQGFEKIKGVFKKEKQVPAELTKPMEPPRFNWKDMIDNLISGIQSEFALYYRKANGQFDSGLPTVSILSIVTPLLASSIFLA